MKNIPLRKLHNIVSGDVVFFLLPALLSLEAQKVNSLPALTPINFTGLRDYFSKTRRKFLYALRCMEQELWHLILFYISYNINFHIKFVVKLEEMIDGSSAWWAIFKQATTAFNIKRLSNAYSTIVDKFYIRLHCFQMIHSKSWHQECCSRSNCKYLTPHNQ